MPLVDEQPARQVNAASSAQWSFVTDLSPSREREWPSTWRQNNNSQEHGIGALAWRSPCDRLVDQPSRFEDESVLKDGFLQRIKAAGGAAMACVHVDFA